MPINPKFKIKEIPELQEILAEARGAGRKIVFGNGCFDLIHVGHTRYLQSAKALGNLLVIGINSDESVRRLKGEGRPLQAQNDRAEILGSMDCVDYVVIFNAPTVKDLLIALKPDIHAKGTDYTPESVPERETVLSYGGRVEIAGDPKDHSSRDLIGAIRLKWAEE